MRDITKYDKFLRIKKNLDGSVVIYRQSPYSAERQYNVLEIQNQYPGSWNWILRQIILNDAQRYDFITPVIQRNKKIVEGKGDDRVTRDLVDTLFETGGEHIII